MSAHRDAQADRLFFALWPEAELQGLLHREALRLQRLCGGRATRLENIHLTLLFLGEVPRERNAELLELAAGVRAPRFELELDQLGFWPRNRIAWAGASVVPDALSELVAALRGALRGAGIGFDDKPFVAHLTLLRKGACPRLAAPERAMPWPGQSFVLVRSALGKTGSSYEAVAQWSLD